MSNIQAFQWTGINKQGLRVNGQIEATDIKHAEAEIRNNGIEIISINSKKATTTTFWGSKKIKTRDIILFTRYLSTMLNAGMPILNALEVISRDQDNLAMKSMVTTVRSNISAGMNFSDALAQFPQYFSELYVNLTRAGERSATLDKVLKDLIKYMEKSERLKRKVKSALIYPTTIVLIAIAVSFILLVFVVPQFEKMFANSKVPLPIFTRIVIQFSNYLQHYWWMVFAGIIGLFYAIKIMKKRSEIFADKLDAFKLRIYVIGDVLKKSIIARFTRTLSITLEAGLPIVDSMRSMSNLMGNRAYTKAINRVSDDLVNGNELGNSLEATKIFPTMVVQMITVGEASGSLSEMLNNIANYYEEEVDNIADNLSTILEPVIIVILGVIMGCFIVAMYLPIFKLGTTI